MKKIILILSSILFFGCCDCDKPKVIINNEVGEGIIIYDKVTSDNRYEVIEVLNDGSKSMYTLDHLIAKDYHVGDTIKHNITFQKN
jgi:hypothetical protein